MSIWNEHKPNAGGGNYLKLKDGDAVKVRFFSPPAVITYDGVKLRYQVVLYNRTAKAAQVYEFGAQVFGQLGDLYEDWGEPGDFDLTLKRSGSGQFDTNYSVTPSPKSVDLTKEELEACETVASLFPGKKAKWLTDYEKDHIMPETIETSKNSGVTTDNIPPPTDADVPPLDPPEDW